MQLFFDQFSPRNIRRKPYDSERLAMFIKEHATNRRKPMETSIRPNSTKFCRHLTGLLRMPDRLDHVGPVCRTYHFLPRPKCSIESTGCKTVQSFLFRGPGVDLLLYVPIEGHRSGRLLREVQEVLICLQTFQGEFSFGDVDVCSVPSDDAARRSEEHTSELQSLRHL